jgi:transglutaminase-like putative cysteine protease
VLVGGVVLLIGLSASALGQFRESDARGAKLGEGATQYWQAGVIVTARSGPCRGMVATAPIPVDWPEQEARIVEEDVSPSAKISYRTVEGTVKQMVVEIPFLAAGAECRAVVTVEVTRHAQLRPENTEVFVLPEKRKIPRAIRPYLGSSPEIQNTSSRIRNLARKLRLDGASAWDQVEAIYDWVRENVEHKQGHQGGALAALQSGTGDHEDLTSLFIALCRASGVPARTVWVQGHSYPEFYLEDKKGEGHWFPCQAAGTRAFGEMPDHRPILQKGDNFRAPNSRERKRYLPETLDGKGGRPSVKFVRELVSR